MTVRSLLEVVGFAGIVSLSASPQLLRASEDSEAERRSFEMAEDLEVLGELVAGTLERFHPEAVRVGVHTDPTMDQWRVHSGQGSYRVKTRVATDGGRRERRKPLAVHLPGYGIVLQAEAPRLGEEPAPAGGGTAAGKAPDEWELARRRLEGAPPPAAAEDRTRAEPTRAEVTGALIDIMARHGHRLRHLAAQERLTMALEIAGAAGDGAAGAPGGGSMSAPGGGTAAAQALFPFLETYSEVDQAGENRILSGDLHLRQRNYEKAAETFRRVTEDYRDDASVRARLLHALAGAGKYEEAKAVLEALAAGARAGDGAAGPAESGLALPARLVISATGDALEKVGTGSISPEEFRKQVQVTHFRPPAGRGTAGASGRSSIDTGRLDGVIDSVDPEEGLVVLSLGKEQGVRLGMRFRAIRRDNDRESAGLLEVVKLYPDVSAARILEGSPEKGDRVRTEVQDPGVRPIRSP